MVSKKKEILNFVILTAAVICLNVIANRFFFRIDLTEENRYSMNEVTKKVLNNLDDQVLQRLTDTALIHDDLANSFVGKVFSNLFIPLPRMPLGARLPLLTRGTSITNRAPQGPAPIP